MRRLNIPKTNISLKFKVELAITEPGWEFGNRPQRGQFADKYFGDIGIIRPTGRMEATANGAVIGASAQNVTVGFVQTIFRSQQRVSFQKGAQYNRAEHLLPVPVRDASSGEFGGQDSPPWYNPDDGTFDSDDEAGEVESIPNPFEEEAGRGAAAGKRNKPGISTLKVNDENTKQKFEISCEDWPSLTYPHIGSIELINFQTIFLLWLVAKVEGRYYALNRSIWMTKIIADLARAPAQKGIHTEKDFKAREGANGSFVKENFALTYAHELHGIGGNHSADYGGTAVVLGGPVANKTSVESLT